VYQLVLDLLSALCPDAATSTSSQQLRSLTNYISAYMGDSSAFQQGIKARPPQLVRSSDIQLSRGAQPYASRSSELKMLVVSGPASGTSAATISIWQ
jgi:hypothetical protein